jgi:hypothetical protein
LLLRRNLRQTPDQVEGRIALQHGAQDVRIETVHLIEIRDLTVLGLSSRCVDFCDDVFEGIPVAQGPGYRRQSEWPTLGSSPNLVWRD